LKEIDRIIISLELEDMKQADITIVGISEIKGENAQNKRKLTENSNAMTETNFKELWQAQTQLRIQILKRLYLKQTFTKKTRIKAKQPSYYLQPCYLHCQCRFIL
jgi:hypothetical protein